MVNWKRYIVVSWRRITALLVNGLEWTTGILIQRYYISWAWTCSQYDVKWRLHLFSFQRLFANRVFACSWSRIWYYRSRWTAYLIASARCFYERCFYLLLLVLLKYFHADFEEGSPQILSVSCQYLCYQSRTQCERLTEAFFSNDAGYIETVILNKVKDDLLLWLFRLASSWPSLSYMCFKIAFVPGGYPFIPLDGDRQSSLIHIPINYFWLVSSLLYFYPQKTRYVGYRFLTRFSKKQQFKTAYLMFLDFEGIHLWKIFLNFICNILLLKKHVDIRWPHAIGKDNITFWTCLKFIWNNTYIVLKKTKKKKKE